MSLLGSSGSRHTRGRRAPAAADTVSVFCTEGIEGVFFAAGEEAEKKVQSVGGGGRRGRREEEELELRLETRERVQYV